MWKVAITNILQKVYVKKISGKQYRQTPAGKASQKAHWHNRRILKKGLTKETIQRVYEDNIAKYGVLTCYLCFKPIINNDDSLDHSIPLSRGGTNNYDNLGIAHLTCNLRKGTKTLNEYKTKLANKVIELQKG